MATKYGKKTPQGIERGIKASATRKPKRRITRRKAGPAPRSSKQNQKINQVPGKISNFKRKALQKQASNLQVIDGIALSHFAASSRSAILKADSVLMDQGFTEGRDVNGSTNKKLALDLLVDLNCSVVAIPSSYSLVTTQTDKITIDNPYIENPQLQTESNQLVATNKSFPDECDPFYELDDPRSRNEQMRMRKDMRIHSVDLTVTAATIANMNLIKKRSTVLDQFLDADDAKRRSKY